MSRLSHEVVFTHQSQTAAVHNANLLPSTSLIECTSFSSLDEVICFRQDLCTTGVIFQFRPYESVSEAVGDHHNHAEFMATGL